MSQQIAHNIESKSRTKDISISDNVDFTAMLLSERVLHGLQKNGFKKPSPIQLKAIPMGRCGFDLIIKAKSGTGKTAVFGIIGLEMVNVKSNELQILILAPTREIAVQIQQVLLTIGIELKGLKVEYFIGGTRIEDDVNKLKNCHIAVGAPGRVKHLIKKSAMKLDTVRLFVLDEADKLMQSSYQADINFIYNKLGPRKQMIASSATYPDELDNFLAKYMTSPMHVSPDSEVPVLLGIKQFAAIVDTHLNVIQQMSIKTNELIRILQTISFTQCIVFSNYQTRAESLSNNLTRLGWPAIFISGAQKQKDRLEAVHSLKEFKCRILSTTDLTARGIDAANVDLVINYEVPNDAETYLHRMGRAGRYGSYGICVTIAADGMELEKLQKIIGKIGDGTLSIAKYPKTEDLPKNIWECDVKDFEQLNSRLEIKDTGLNIETENKVNIENDENIASTSKITTPSNEESHTKMKDPENICNPMQELTVKLNKPESNFDESQILQIMSTDKDEDNMGDFIGKMLNDLNKKEDLTKTELKNRFGNLDSSSLFETLAKSTCTKNEQKSNIACESIMNGDIESTNSVQQMLENISKSDEMSKTEIKNKYGDLDASSLLVMLSKGVNSDESKNEDSTIKKSKSKKIKVNKNIQCKNEANESEDTHANCQNKQFENEAKMFQENNIFNKNVALYKLTALLVDEQQTVNEDCVTSIGNLLNIIQQEDVIDKANIDLPSAISDILNIKQELKPKTNMEDFKKDQEPVAAENENVKTISCGCSQNIFSDTYAFAISQSDRNWRSFLCQTHLHIKDETIVDKYGKEKEMKEDYYEDGEDIYDDYYYYGERQYGNTEQMYQHEEYNQAEAGNYYRQEDNTNANEFDENLFVKAYDYALNSETEDQAFSENTSEYFSENMKSSGACGYAAGFSYKNFSFKNRNKRKHTNYERKMVDCIKGSSHINENYESYYDYYDKVLTQNVPYFNNIQSFEKFFKKWQENVYAVRNYIQEDVYTKEMLRRSK